MIKRFFNKKKAMLDFKRQLKNILPDVFKLTFVFETVKVSFYGSARRR